VITFFTVVRPFVGEFDAIQRDALWSWRDAVPEGEIQLFGRVEGAVEAAVEVRAPLYEPQRSEAGTPLLNHIFSIAEKRAHHEWLCNINADCVLPDGEQIRQLIRMTETIERPLIIGQRTDWDMAKNTRTLHPPSGMDYFLYRRGTLGDLPPFAVGCTAYDNWLVWAAMERWGMTVIDATGALDVWHINHEYPYDGGKAGMLNGKERERNHALAKATGCPRWYGVNDAPNIIEHGKVVLRG
jgi:hypothetical protein